MCRIKVALTCVLGSFNTPMKLKADLSLGLYSVLLNVSEWVQKRDMSARVGCGVCTCTHLLTILSLSNPNNAPLSSSDNLFEGKRPNSDVLSSPS